MSPSKAELQRLRSLREKKNREALGLFVIEGEKVVGELIAANTGGVLDIIKDGENGLLFNPERPEAIGALVRRLRQEPGLRERLAGTGLSHARGRSWQATMDQLIDYYRVARRVFRFTRRRALGSR